MFNAIGKLAYSIVGLLRKFLDMDPHFKVGDRLTLGKRNQFPESRQSGTVIVITRVGENHYQCYYESLKDSLFEKDFYTVHLCYKKID